MAWKILLLAVVIALISTEVSSFAHGPHPIIVTPSPPTGHPHATSFKCEILQGSLSLNFHHDGLRRIESDFADSPHVNCLNLEDNEIAYVSPTAFQHMPNLLYLNLAHNKLPSANFSHLVGHSHLRTLILDDNNPAPQENTILKFENLFPRLLHLYLRNNSLKDLSSLAFAPKLTHLYLSSNDFGDSELSFLDDAPACLISLDLADNGIQGFNTSKLTSLQKLWLDGNQIKRLCGKSYCRDSALVLEGATSLDQLSLARNQLTSIEPDAFDDAENLEDLDLSYNKIDNIRKNTFEKVEIMRNLSLKANLLIEMPDLCGPASLEYLSLADNQLQVVKNESFCLMDKLKFVDLSNNQIRIIEPEAFEKQIYLEILNLSNNHLARFPNAWLTPLANLQILHVGDNQLRRLTDLGLENVKTNAKLENVYLQNNLITKFDTSSLYNVFKGIHNITLVIFDASNQFHGLQQDAPRDNFCNCNCDKDNEVL